MPPIISVESLGKRYRIRHQVKQDSAYQYLTLREEAARWARGLFRRRHGRGSATQRETREDFWALRDVSFEIQEGDAVGIIGRNGAGKSTLLKILSRITEPTTGRAVLRGRVASLLEVGTGFHPELTGRENIFLNGAILGMNRSEIRARFDEIVAFAEIEKFLDTPVKRYSSGMYVRLAFAVAAHLEPEVLIVDEVLAVGDASFQRKCLGKMRDVSRSEGRTVIFVSHNLTAVKTLCKRAVLLSNGEIDIAGQTEIVVGKYLSGTIAPTLEVNWNYQQTGPDYAQTWVRRLKLESVPSEGTGEISVSSNIRLIVDYWNNVENAELNVSIVLYTDDDVCAFNTWSNAERLPRGFIRSTCLIPSNTLNDNRYRIRLLIVRDRSIPLIDLDNALWFDVKDTAREGGWLGKILGTVRPKLQWETNHLDHQIA